MVTVFTSNPLDADFLQSEAPGYRSRDAMVVLSGQNLKAGQVVGKVAHDATAAGAAVAGNTGNGVLGAVTVGAGAKPGVHKLTITTAAANAGTFSVEDPDGVIIDMGTVGVAFAGGGLSFTLADGAADFVVGDQFTITVDGATDKVTELDPAGTDGRENAIGILLHTTDGALAADKKFTIITRDAEVSLADLTWKSGTTSPQKTAALAQLALLGIIAR